MPEEKKKVELSNEDLDQVTGGGDVIDCKWGDNVSYQIELDCAYVRNNAVNYIYVPIAKVSDPVANSGWGGGGNSFYVFSCRYYEYGNYVDTHEVGFGKNDTITKVVEPNH